MGWLFKTTKKVTGQLVNYRIEQWIDYENLKGTFLYIVQKANNLFSDAKKVHQQDRVENPDSFDQVKERFQLSDQDLEIQATKYLHFTLFFLLMSFVIFCYFLYLILKMHNLLGACMTFALLLFGLSQAFRYHFWRFQIKSKMMNCGLKDWWAAAFKRIP